MTSREGTNAITFAVSEDVGDWGILARVLDADGVTIVPWTSVLQR